MDAGGVCATDWRRIRVTCGAYLLLTWCLRPMMCGRRSWYHGKYGVVCCTFDIVRIGDSGSVLFVIHAFLIGWVGDVVSVEVRV